VVLSSFLESTSRLATTPLLEGRASPKLRRPEFS